MEKVIKLGRYPAVLFGLIALVLAGGLGASWLVGRAADRIATSSEKLVHEAMADTQGLDAFRTRLLEHERLAYEAYGAIEPEALAERQQQVRRRLQGNWSQLREWGLPEARRQRLAEHWTAIQRNSDRLYANLRSPNTDWDAARAQLAAMTERRKAMEPVLADLSQRLEKRAMAANASNRQNLEYMSTLVAVYTAVIFLIALMVAWVLWRMVAITHTNQALAEFPRRNPSPVLALEAGGRVFYANPAADRLATQVAGPGSDGAELLDADTTAAITAVRHGSRDVERGQHVLRVEWDWLADLERYHAYARDITEQRRAEERLRRMAYEDGVTGLPNREGLLVELGRCLGEGVPGVLIVGLDRFGHLAAQSGFEAADALLVEVGGELQRQVREHCGADAIVGRLDGALFGVVVPDPNLTSEAVEALRASLPREIRTPHALFQADYRVGFRPPQAGEIPHQQRAPELLRDANTALVTAERDAAPRVVVHDNALQAAEQYHGRLEACLSEAVRGGRGLQAYIQPKLRLTDGVVVGGELLARWEDPDLGWVSPGQFIPIAEQSGLILELGQWVLGQAVACLTEWQDEPAVAESQLAFNVAPPELYDPAWAEDVLVRLQRAGVDPDRLEVEVTERVLAGPEGSVSVDNLARLRAAGVAVSVDDFGTGYSSLAYIHRLPINRVKIDKQFVDPLPIGTQGVSLARVIVEMAEGLGLETIAEGVEHQPQAETLRAMGCGYAQGFLYARPMPAADFPAFARQWSNA